MRTLRCQDGAALITALMLTMLSLVIALALLSTVMTGTRIAASQKRYRTALAAAHGGVDLFTREIVPRLFLPGSSPGSVRTDFLLIDLQLSQSRYDCLRQKLHNATANWTGCGAEVSSDPAVSPDVTFKLTGELPHGGFEVSTKIVDTVPGNSDKHDIGLDAGLSASGRDEVIHPRHVPGIYNISVQGVREGVGAREKASLGVLYAY